MSEKLMTLRELSEYLNVGEDRIVSLVEEKFIPAYKIGGELLRFRKEQIDAMRKEIDSRTKNMSRKKGDKISGAAGKTAAGRESARSGNSFIDSLRDFFYFNDFYILSTVLIAALLVVILKG